MPGKVFVFRTCGRHFGVESANAGPSKCEACAVEGMGGNASFTPAYMWNGRNYLLKMMLDKGKGSANLEMLRALYDEHHALDEERSVMARNSN